MRRRDRLVLGLFLGFLLPKSFLQFLPWSELLTSEPSHSPCLG